MPGPGDDGTDETEDNEDALPAEPGHECDCDDRTNHRAEERAAEDGGTGLALLIVMEPLVAGSTEGWKDRAFAEAESHADCGEAELALCKSGEGGEEGPPEDSEGARLAQAKAIGEDAARHLHQGVACEEAGLDEAHVNLREAELLHNDRRGHGQVDTIHICDETDQENQCRHLPTIICTSWRGSAVKGSF